MSASSALVEEPAVGLGDLAAVDLNAGGGQQEHTRRDPLDGSMQTEDQAGGEVDHATPRRTRSCR